jgi:hypothetical protein
VSSALCSDLETGAFAIALLRTRAPTATRVDDDFPTEITLNQASDSSTDKARVDENIGVDESSIAHAVRLAFEKRSSAIRNPKQGRLRMTRSVSFVGRL